MEDITNLFDALKALNELEDKTLDVEEEHEDTVKMQKKELRDYIQVMLHRQAEKDVKIRTIHIPQDPEGEKEVEIVFADAVQFYEAISMHIGKPGFFVKGDPRFPIDTLLKIKVKLEKEGVEFTVSGKVVWVNPKASKGKPPGMGIKLYKMDTIQRELFDDFTRGAAEPDMLTALSEI